MSKQTMAQMAQEFSDKGMTDKEAIAATYLYSALMAELTGNKAASNHFLEKINPVP
jgi:hypothetical protein